MRRLPLIGFLTAHGVSAAGSRLTLVALPWLVLSTTGSATQTGLVAFVELSLYVAASAFGAPLVDRFGRRRVAVGSQLISAATVACVPLLFDGGHLAFSGLLGIVAVAGLAQGIASSATHVLLPDVIEAADASMERSLSVFDGIDRLSTLLAAPAAGVLIAWMGAVNVLWLDAASFLLSAALLASFARTPGKAPSTKDAEPYLTALAKGARYMFGDRLLVVLCVMLTFTNMASQAFTVVFVPVWIRDNFGDPAMLGMIAGSFGVAAVCGNVLFTWLGPKLPRRWTFAICFLIAGSPRFFAMAFTDDIAVVLAVSFASGLATASLNPIISAVMFARIPEELRARVLGLSGALSWVGIPLGALLGGLAVSGFGPSGALLAGGLLYLVATLSPFVQGIWRGMDRGDEPVRERELARTAV
ncbi:MFS transporter [Phytomonospora endophytica]|uniref:Multidrug efflux pump Tap n=1 Tax=Phytomonospora endophytica TaxID=714109 RepID=A0A841FZ24_9ACTN|nr:MFS transporter [Phytomonospora endophytica]MBB6037200.1 MFS family permease [Phytomonospora endophytica]GIG71299.1 putative multidrug-efflux transporter [Phytomonospora endophytica]